MEEHPYPQHIYGQIRVEIATVFLKRELRKMLPNIRGTEIWKQVDKDIENWFPQDHQTTGVRDFWDGFHGLAMGFKLKNGFTQVLTAQNIQWRFIEQFPLDNKLASGGPLTYISEELSENRPRALKIKEFFNDPKNKKLADFWRQEFKKHGQSSEPRDNFPIIALQGEDNGQEIYSIYDGNRRMILAVLEGKETLPAYVGAWTTKETIPQNFWLPTDFMMDLVDLGKTINTEESYKQTFSLLKTILPNSESGQYELKERVLVGQNEFRVRLKKDLFTTSKV